MLGVRSSDLQKLDAAKVAITFDQLDELSIDGREELEENVFRLISNNPNISKFTLQISIFSHWYDEEMKEETAMKLAKALPSLKELDLWWTKLSADNVITFINKCLLLKSIQCRITSGLDEYIRLKNMIGAEWRSYITVFDDMVLER